VPIGEGIGRTEGARQLEIGVRPEFVHFADTGIPAEVVKVSDAGRHRIVEVRASGSRVHLLAPIGGAIPEGTAHLAFDPARTRVYADSWLTERST
jgi:glycerol transport system ATP-binding protein